MPMHQLINAINSGLPDFYKRLEELRNSTLSDEERNQKILQMFGLQTNLIFFLEQTVKKMDILISEQQAKIATLEGKKTKMEGKNE